MSTQAPDSSGQAGQSAASPSPREGSVEITHRIVTADQVRLGDEVFTGGSVGTRVTDVGPADLRFLAAAGLITLHLDYHSSSYTVAPDTAVIVTKMRRRYEIACTGCPSAYPMVIDLVYQTPPVSLLCHRCATAGHAQDQDAPAGQAGAR